jgi:hypothetical protein
MSALRARPELMRKVILAAEGNVASMILRIIFKVLPRGPYRHYRNFQQLMERNFAKWHQVAAYAGHTLGKELDARRYGGGRH